MGYAVYEVGLRDGIGHRWGGYGIPAYCEHPDCDKEIDRGMSYACGGEPFSEWGCDRYFCGDHKQYACWLDGEPTDDSDKADECREVCERCAKNEQKFPYKPEHPKWVDHFLKDPSWATYRKKHPDEVKSFKAMQANPYKP